MRAARSMLRHIGGRAAVTWQGLLVAYLVSLGAFLAGTGPTHVSLASRVGIVTLATLAGFAPLLVAYWLRARLESPRPRPVLMLLLFVLAAFIRGVVLAMLAVQIGVDPQMRFVFRVFSAMPAIVLAFAITAIVVGSTRERVARLAELSRVNAALAEAQARTELAVADDQAALVDRIVVQLQDELDDIDPNRPAESARSLQRLSAEVVRPLSHQLAQSVPTWEPTAQARTLPRISIWAVIAQVSQGKPFMEIPMAAALAAIGAGMTFSLVSPTLAIALIMVQAGSVIALLVVLNALIEAIPQSWPHWVRPVAFVGSLLLCGILAAAFVYAAVPTEELRLRIAAATFWLVVLFNVLFAMVKAYGKLQVRLEESVREQNAHLGWSVARARQTQWFQQRSLSRLLHGPVQSALDATAMRLDAAVRNRTDAAPIVESARADLRAVLDDVVAAPYRTASIEDATKRITAVWSGLCSIEIGIDPDAMAVLGDDEVGRMVLIELLTEGAANSISHGNATVMSMRVGLEHDLIAVSILDNSTTSIQRAAAGLGSRMRNECAVDWSRHQVEGGYRLQARFPVSALAPLAF